MIVISTTDERGVIFSSDFVASFDCWSAVHLTPILKEIGPRDASSASKQDGFMKKNSPGLQKIDFKAKISSSTSEEDMIDFRQASISP